MIRFFAMAAIVAAGMVFGSASDASANCRAVLSLNNMTSHKIKYMGIKTKKKGGKQWFRRPSSHLWRVIKPGKNQAFDLSYMRWKPKREILLDVRYRIKKGKKWSGDKWLHTSNYKVCGTTHWRNIR